MYTVDIVVSIIMWFLCFEAGHPELRHPGLTHFRFPVACIFLLLFSAVLLSVSSKGMHAEEITIL